MFHLAPPLPYTHNFQNELHIEGCMKRCRNPRSEILIARSPFLATLFSKNINSIQAVFIVETGCSIEVRLSEHQRYLGNSLLRLPQLLNINLIMVIGFSSMVHGQFSVLFYSQDT